MKAYIVAQIHVATQELYNEYIALAPATVAAFGGKYLARNGRKLALEGELQDCRLVVIEFPSFDQARAWYSSPDYQEVVQIRHRAEHSSSIVLIEGSERAVI